MLTTLLGWLGSFLANLFAKLAADKRADSNSQDLGKAAGSDQTNQAISETSDAQARNNAVNRGDARDVAGRLRKRPVEQSHNDRQDQG